MKDHIYKVQVAEQSTSSDKENWKCNAKSKKAAYGFFKNLSNQYAASDKYVEDFCYGSTEQRHALREKRCDNCSKSIW